MRKRAATTVNLTELHVQPPPRTVRYRTVPTPGAAGMGSSTAPSRLLLDRQPTILKLQLLYFIGMEAIQH